MNKYSYSRSNYSSGVHICNLTKTGISLASTSVQRSDTQYRADKYYVFRGWFNLSPNKCMSISNIFGLDGYAALYVEPEERNSATVSIDSSFNGSLVGPSGFMNIDTPICINNGSSFRRGIGGRPRFTIR